MENEQFDAEFVQSVAKRRHIDARRSNVHFASPPSVDLITGEGLAGIEIELPAEFGPHSEAAASLLEKVKVSLGVSDVSDAFHRMRIGKELSAYFCLPAVTAGELRMTGWVLILLDGLRIPQQLRFPIHGEFVWRKVLQFRNCHASISIQCRHVLGS